MHGIENYFKIKVLSIYNSVFEKYYLLYFPRLASTWREPVAHFKVQTVFRKVLVY